jgi:FixJ family two-component response regulator
MNVRKSIYVVDDEVAIASTLAAILVESGYSAKYFTSPFGSARRRSVRTAASVD